MVRSIKRFCFLYLLAFIIAAVLPLKNAYAQADDAVSTEGLVFTDLVAEEDTLHAAADSLTKTTLESKSTDVKSTTVAIANQEEKRSLWAIFIAGFLGGFAAFIMPCIFPMLPLTVSFFTKKSRSKAQSISQALIYGISIIVIYVVLGLLVTVIFGADALNSLSTNGVFNMLFFVLLMVFAVSFLGAFEINLPTSWVNKMDKKSDKGGLTGLFFMAATLALVSF